MCWTSRRSSNRRKSKRTCCSHAELRKSEDRRSRNRHGPVHSLSCGQHAWSRPLWRLFNGLLSRKRAAEWFSRPAHDAKRHHRVAQAPRVMCVVDQRTRTCLMRMRVRQTSLRRRVHSTGECVLMSMLHESASEVARFRSIEVAAFQRVTCLGLGMLM